MRSIATASVILFLQVLSMSQVHASAALNSLDGHWYSKEWRYSYLLKNGVGQATSTNSPNFQVGQDILFLEATGNGVYRGRQVYTDGKFYAVSAVLQSNGELHFSGERNARWVMRKSSESVEQPRAQASKNECDELAGSPRDPEKISTGVTWDKLDFVSAVRACKAAVLETPRSGRTWFQYGRALAKASQLPQAFDSYRLAMALIHDAAHNNL